MFNVNFTDIKNILQDYNITNKFISFSELQRFHYERVDQQSKQVRLIVKIDFEDSNSTKTNAFCLGIILCNVSRSFDYLIYPYYPAYTS